MTSVFAGLRAGVVVVDSELLVQVWNHQAEELWGVRHEEAAGRHLLSLDIGLPLEQVRPLVRSLLNGDQQEATGVIPAVNRRGRPVVVRVTASPLRYGEEVNGVILVMDAHEDREPADRAG